MKILDLPAAFQVAQAGFGLQSFDRVERRRSGVEDVFSGGPPRWTARFSVLGDPAALSAWRGLVARLGGARGLVRVGDIADRGPVGGVRTAAARAATSQVSISWADGSGGAVDWTDGASGSVSWDLHAPTPAQQALRLGATAPAGAEVVRLEGLWPSLPGVIRSGEYVQIGSWLHVATADAISDADGVAEVLIAPPLRRNEAQGATIALERTTTVMRLDVDEVAWSRAARERRAPLSVSFSEVLPTEAQ